MSLFSVPSILHYCGSFKSLLKPSLCLFPPHILSLSVWFVLFYLDSRELFCPSNPNLKTLALKSLSLGSDRFIPVSFCSSTLFFRLISLLFYLSFVILLLRVCLEAPSSFSFSLLWLWSASRASDKLLFGECIFRFVSFALIGPAVVRIWRVLWRRLTHPVRLWKQKTAPPEGLSETDPASDRTQSLLRLRGMTIILSAGMSAERHLFKMNIIRKYNTVWCLCCVYTVHQSCTTQLPDPV